MNQHFSALDESWLQYRRAGTSELMSASLPFLFLALARDEVQDFPALRPHQRHPWHAFLVHLAAIALHRAGRATPFSSAKEWHDALLALTPQQPDGCAWCLVAPVDQPALLQPPAPQGIGQWRPVPTPDALDMLVTSKNHDLKIQRMKHGTPQDWLFALVSLQTQEGFLGSGNYGISRMNGGFASRPGLGVVPFGGIGRRWQRDVAVLLKHRAEIAHSEEMSASDGHSLLWLLPWDGTTSLGFSSLDPLYIEVCRRVRLTESDGAICAQVTGSKVARIQAKEREGRTGDAWTPIDASAGKALTITSQGFHYRLASDLLFGSKYRRPPAQVLQEEDDAAGLAVLARSVTRGQGKTEGYHERRVPLSPKTSRLLRTGQIDIPAKLAEQRIAAIGELRKLLWSAMCILLSNGVVKEASDSNKTRAGIYVRRFEAAEDARFFRDLFEEVDSDESARSSVYDAWLLACAERAETVLKEAFVIAPRSGMQRYRAQAAALSRFRGGLRGPNSPLPVLKRLYAERYIAEPSQEAEDARI
jgi:CRISPR system Cascade subunit CasA